MANTSNGKGGRLRRILIIDDDRDLCEETAEILSDEGHKVETFSDPVKGLEAVKEDRFDLLLLDIKMPGLSGLEILKTLRSEGRKIPVLIITGNPLKNLGHSGDSNDEEQRVLRTADGIIGKPFDVPEMLSQIKKILPQE